MVVTALLATGGATLFGFGGGFSPGGMPWVGVMVAVGVAVAVAVGVGVTVGVFRAPVPPPTNVDHGPQPSTISNGTVIAWLGSICSRSKTIGAPLVAVRV